MNLFLAGVTDTFGRNHLIFACICLAIMIVCPILIRKYNIPFKKLTIIFLIIWVVCETTKLLSNITYIMEDKLTEELKAVRMFDYVASEWENWIIVRAYLPRGDLPFHLCSIMSFFILFANFTKNEVARERVLGLIAPFGLIGSIISIALATIGADFKDPQTYEYFFYHAFLAVYSLEIVLKKEINPTWKLYLSTAVFSLILFVSSIWVNTILSDTGVLGVSNKYLTNFFYSMKPPLSGLPFLNLNHGWIVYFIHIVSLGVIIVTAYYAILIGITKKQKEKESLN